MTSKPAYPDKKKLIVSEVDNMLDKLTREFGVSPAYAAIQISAYCMAQVAAISKSENKPIPEEVEHFLTETYPTLLQEHTNLIEEQFTMLNCEGSA